MRDASRSPERERILAREPFLERLRQERSKSDREGGTFAVLAYAPDDAPGKSADEAVDLRSVGHVLAGRLRTTDELGWLEPGVLGVLLLDVDADTAGRLAQELVLGQPRLRCTVHPHPPLAWYEDGEPGGRPEASQRSGNGSGDAAKPGEASA